MNDNNEPFKVSPGFSGTREPFGTPLADGVAPGTSSPPVMSPAGIPHKIYKLMP